MAGGQFLPEWKKERIIKLYNRTTLSQYEIADTMLVAQSTVSKVIKEYKNGKLHLGVEADNTSSN